MPYDIFGNPVDYSDKRSKEELEQESRWRWFGVGGIIGLLVGLAIAL